MSAATMEKQAAARGLVTPGDFVWYELMSADAAAAEKFYGAVLGWTVNGSPVGEQSYRVISTNGHQIGGIMSKAQPPSGAQSMWVGYIGVSNVDAMAERIRAQGGVVHHGPADLPGIGRFAVVADPQGAMFYLFKGNLATPPPRVPASTLGSVGWQELQAADGKAAWEFYEGLFGWHKSQAFDMGPMGVYQTFSTNDEQPMTGGMMTKMEGAPGPVWRFCFNVQGIQEVVERVKSNGGKVTQGPMQVPGGRWTAQCLDPQGAMFGLLSDN